jgi:hypothetical protein
MLRIECVRQHRVAVAVGLAFQRVFAFGVENAQFDPANAAAVLQRRGVHEQLVLVGADMQADVADGEERGVVLIAEQAGALHHREVKARLLQFFDVLNRQIGDDAFVGLAVDGEAVGEDRFGEFGDRFAIVVVVIQFPAAAAAGALVAAEELRQ